MLNFQENESRTNKMKNSKAISISVNSSERLLKLGESLGKYNVYYKNLHEQRSHFKRGSLTKEKASRIKKLDKQLSIVKSKIVQIEHLINSNEAQKSYADAKRNRKIKFMFNYVSPHNFVTMSNKEKEKLFLNLNGYHGIEANLFDLLGSKQHFDFYRSQLQKQINKNKQVIRDIEKQIKTQTIKAQKDKFYALMSYLEFIELKEKLALLVDEQKTLKSRLRN